MTRIAAALICQCTLAGCGGDGPKGPQAGRDITCWRLWTVTVRRAKRAMLARMSAAVFVHTYGWPAVLEASMNSRIADSSERTLSCTPRRSCFISRAANQRSTRLSHEAYVGVKCG